MLRAFKLPVYTVFVKALSIVIKKCDKLVSVNPGHSEFRGKLTMEASQ